MIDRTARDSLSWNLRRFIAGKISNDEFEDGVPRASDDPAIKAISDMAWLFYSDMEEHRLVGRHSIDPAARREALRWIIFLDSDVDYRWPRIRLPGLSPARRVRPLLTRWLRSHAMSHRRATEFLAAGDHHAWPFVSRAEVKRALKQPRRLAGRRKQATCREACA